MTMSNDMLISKRLKFPTNTSLQLLKILDGVGTYTLTSGLKKNTHTKFSFQCVHRRKCQCLEGM